MLVPEQLDDKIEFGISNRAERRRYKKLLRRMVAIPNRRKYEKRWVK